MPGLAQDPTNTAEGSGPRGRYSFGETVSPACKRARCSAAFQGQGRIAWRGSPTNLEGKQEALALVFGIRRRDVHSVAKVLGW